MASSPAFASTPATQIVAVNVANTARDGTGTLFTLYTAGANGSRVERITVSASGTTATGSVTLFLNNGSTKVLYREVPITAVTASNTAPAFSAALNLGLILPSGWSLLAGSTVGTNIFVTAEGANF